jgi:hypothetical protein
MAQEQTPYYQASRYPTKSAAGKAYTPMQQLIHEVECDLSTYRLFVPNERKWYVVVIGEQPDQQLHERLKTMLTTQSRGEPARLDAETVAVLSARRLQQIQHGPWVEGHYPLPEHE